MFVTVNESSHEHERDVVLKRSFSLFVIQCHPMSITGRGVHKPLFQHDSVRLF